MKLYLPYLYFLKKTYKKVKLFFITINLSAFISFLLSLTLPVLLKIGQDYLDEEIVKLFNQFLLSYSCGYIIFFMTVEFQRIRELEAIYPSLFFWSFEYGGIKDLMIIKYSGIPISNWNEYNYENKVNAIKTLLSFNLQIDKEHYKDELIKDLRHTADKVSNINFHLISFFPYLKNDIKSQFMNLLRNKGSEFLDIFYQAEISTELNLDFTSAMIMDFITNIENIESKLSITTKPFLDIQDSINESTPKSRSDIFK